MTNNDDAHGSNTNVLPFQVPKKAMPYPPWSIQFTAGARYNWFLSIAAAVIGWFVATLVVPVGFQMHEAASQATSANWERDKAVRELAATQATAQGTIESLTPQVQALRYSSEQLGRYGAYLFYQQFRIQEDAGLVAVVAGARVVYAGRSNADEARFIVESPETVLQTWSGLADLTWRDTLGFSWDPLHVDLPLVADARQTICRAGVDMIFALEGIGREGVTVGLAVRPSSYAGEGYGRGEECDGQ